MLTDPLLVDHVRCRRLCEWESQPGVPIRMVRSLLLTEDVHDHVTKEHWPREPSDRSDAAARERKRSLIAVGNSFVTGRPMSPDIEVKSLDPTDNADFANLLEMRSGPPRPQSRLFVYVYVPGVWIAVGFSLRNDLGEYGDQGWADAASTAKTAWLALFGTRKPFPVQHPCNTFDKVKRLTDGR